MTETVRINCNLRGDIAVKFEEIKKLTGIQQNTEIVRLAVNDLFNKIGKNSRCA